MSSNSSIALLNHNEIPVKTSKIDISFNEDELDDVMPTLGHSNRHHSNDSSDSDIDDKEYLIDHNHHHHLRLNRKSNHYHPLRNDKHDDAQELSEITIEISQSPIKPTHGDGDDDDYPEEELRDDINNDDKNTQFVDNTSESSSIEGFENITLDQSNEKKHKTNNNNNNANNQNISQQSPFKKLLSQKFKSFTLKDPSELNLNGNTGNSNNSGGNRNGDKYNTFPLSPTKLFFDSDKSTMGGSGGVIPFNINITNSSGSSAISTPPPPSSSSSSSLSSDHSSVGAKDFSPLSLYHINCQPKTPELDSMAATTTNSAILLTNIENVNNSTHDNDTSTFNLLNENNTTTTTTSDSLITIIKSNLTRPYSFSTITRPVLQSEISQLNSRIIIFLSLSMFFAVSNLYYTQPLLMDIGETFGLSHSVISLIPMSVQVGYAAGLLFISTTGDIISKKTLILLLSGLTCMFLIAVGLSPHIAMMLIAYFLVGLTSVIPNIAIPLAIDMSTPQERRTILSILTSSLFIGLLGSRVISGLIGHLFGWRVVFYAAAVGTFLVNLCLFIFLPYTPRSAHPIPYKELIASILEIFKADEILRSSYFIGACILGMFSVFWTTLCFRLAEEPYSYSSAFIGLFGLFGMAAAITPLSGKLSERFSANLLLHLYMLLSAIGYLVMMFLDAHLVALIIGIFVLDVGVQSIHISNQSHMNSKRYESQHMKSRVNSSYLSSYFIGGAVGSALSGLVYSHWGWSGTSVLGLVFIGLAYSCHLIFYPKASTPATLNN